MSDFFFNVPATPEICTLSLHDALPISYRNNYTASNDTLFLLPAPSAYCRQQSTLSEIVCQTDTENFLELNFRSTFIPVIVKRRHIVVVFQSRINRCRKKFVHFHADQYIPIHIHIAERSEERRVG